MAVFHLADYIVFTVTIVASFSIGVFYACRKSSNSPESYLVANRKMNMIPIAISMLASFFSAVSMLGNSSEVFYYGFECFFIIVGWNLGMLVISVTFIPLLQPLRVVSVHEYLWLRFRVRPIVLLGTFLQVLAICVINGVVLFGPALMLKSMAGVPVWATILAGGLISTVYTTIGGFKAVIWSDVFQAVAILAGLVLINILGTVKAGGVKEVWQTFYEHGRFDLRITPSPFERSTVWGFVFGMMFSAISSYGVAQISVQRYCALPTLREAKRTVYMYIPEHMIVLSLTVVSGVVAFSYFTKIGCDPLQNGQITNPNQILPFFIQEVLNYPCIPGLFVACIFCGSLSNLSSAYNSAAALLWEDIFKHQQFTKNLSTVQKSLITKVLSLITGLCTIAAGFGISYLGGTLTQIFVSITGSVYLPITVIIALGALTPRTSWKSALVGGMVSVSLIAWIIIGSTLAGPSRNKLPTVSMNCTMPDGYKTIALQANNTFDGQSFHYNTMKTTSTTAEPESEQDVFFLYQISYLWYAPLGLIVGLTVGIVLAFIPGFRNKEEVNMSYLFPFVRKMYSKKQEMYIVSDCKDNENNVFLMKEY